MKYLFLLLILALLFIDSKSQSDLRFKELTANNSEEIIGVQKFFKDSQGFMWMGSPTSDLLRFDGRNTRKYSSEELKTKYFNSTHSILIFEDSKRDLWIGTNVGALMRYNKNADHFDVANDSTTSIRSSLFCQAEDADGSFWMGTLGGGLINFHPQTKKFSLYQFDASNNNSIPDNYITGLVFDKSGTLWIATTSGLCSYNSTTNQVIRYPLANNNPADTYRYRVIRSMLLSADKLYLGTYGGLQIFNTKTLQSEHLIHNQSDPASLSHNSLFQLAENPDSTLWIATYGGGLNLYNPITKKFNSWQHDEANSESISGNNIFSVFLDNAGLLWIGPNDNTVCVHDTNAKKFHAITHRLNRPESISSGWIHTIFQENDSIFWLGLNGNGLNRVNLKSGVTKQFKNDPTNPHSIGHNMVRAIAQDKGKVIWLGLEGGGINALNQATGKFTRFESSTRNSISNNAVSSLLIDQDNLIWITTFRSGLNVYNINQNRFIRINDDSLKRQTGISFATATKAYELNGNIWFQSPGQLVVFDKSKNQFVKIGYNDGVIAPATATSFLELRPYSETEMLLFTTDAIKTIQYTDPEHIKQTIIAKREKGDDVFKSFVIDRSNYIWYATKDRLVKWNPKTSEKRVFTKSDGIISNELNEVFLDKQGRVFLTSLNGFNWFLPEEIVDDTVSRKIIFTDFKLYNKSVPISKSDTIDYYTLPQAISQLTSIELEFAHTFFSIEFNAIEFMAPDKILYSYKLEGFDRDWITVGNRNFASYTNLDPGKYTFQVKATNPDGFWGSKTATIAIAINPPYWGTWWFISLIVILIGSIIYSIHRYRLVQSLQVERLRNKIASDLHDEIGSSLTRISLYSDLLQTNTDHTESKNYLLSIRELSREIVTTMSDVVWSIDNRNDSLGALIIRIKDFATELLYSKNITLIFTVTDLDEKKLLDPILRQNLYLICKEAVNNIVKHAHATEVKMVFTNTDHEFILSIQDNGKGFSDSKQKGNGLRNMAKRAEALDGILRIENHHGTKLTVHRKPI